MAVSKITNPNSLGISLSSNSLSAKIYNEYIQANSSVVLNVSSGLKAVLFSTRYDEINAAGLYYIATKSDGSNTIVTPVIEARNATITTNGTQITITNTVNAALMFTILCQFGSVNSIS